jgi:hypothetical protein
MKPSRPRILPIALLASLLFAMGASAASPSRAADASGYQSATVCQECHAEIYAEWEKSEHATAFVSSDFQVPYDRIRRASPGKTLSCEQCHNPMRFLLPPGDHRVAIFAQEGVGCVFCHSVESVNAKGQWPRYRSSPGVMFGPQGGNPKNKAHVTQFSRLHITSDFCAGCHEFRNEYGVPILTTVSEWEQSFYRGEQVHCQYCHLPELFDTRFIDKEKKKGPADHGMVGGHSPERLARAIPIRATLGYSGDEANLAVTLKNETVGHKTPSGLPLHRIRLVSTLYDLHGNILDRQVELFERVIGDGSGKPLDNPERVFTDGREVLKDNRIGPKETRVVKQRFALHGAKPATAGITLTYEMPTPDIAPKLKMSALPISQIVIPAKAESPSLRLALIALAAVALIAALVALKRRS